MSSQPPGPQPPGPPSDPDNVARSSTVARLIHEALWAEGGETVEGAFVDRYVSDASLAYDDLKELFQGRGFSETDAELFRQAMRREPTEKMADLLEFLRPWTGPVVLEMLDDPEPKARATALGVAWRFRPVESLAAYLKDPDPTVRAAALNAVSDQRHGVPEKEREVYLERACADPSPQVRRVAGYGLMFSATPEARRKLARVIENEPDQRVRDDLVTALAAETARSGVHVDSGRLNNLLGSDLRAILIRELNNDNEQLRETVVEALARLRGPDVGNALLDRLAVEESGSVRFAMRHYGGFHEVLDRALEVFGRRLEVEAEPWIRETLGNLRLLFFRQIAAELRREELDGEPRRNVDQPSAAAAVAIQSRIDALPGKRGIDFPTSAFKRDLNALPLFGTSALYVWGIRPDGTVIRLDLDAVADADEVETDPLIRFAVIVHGAARYPELRALIPTPPAKTRLCKACRGTGDDPNDAGQSCSGCRGYGWRITPSARTGRPALDPGPKGETARPDDPSTTAALAEERVPGINDEDKAHPIGLSRTVEPQLYSPRQLPDLAHEFRDGELRFEWDQDGTDSIVRHGGGAGGGVILWRERTTGQTAAGQGTSERFAEIAEVLRSKYGENLKDLAPTPAGLRALVGDGPPAAQEEAAARVAAARAALGTAPETLQIGRYDFHSLAFAIQHGNREMVRRFLAQGGDPNTVNYGQGTTMLHVAAKCREETIVRMLLCAGAAPDRIDSFGRSPLAGALDQPHTPSPWHGAALAIVRLLAGAGASLDGLGEMRTLLQERGGRTYKPPLALAARYGNVAAMRFLLERGADPDQADFGGMTALHNAASAGIVETARLLCEAGADANAAYEPPLWTPLHSVIYSSDARQKETTAPLIRLLVQFGADINKGESGGNSPLFAAVSEARHDLVRLLLKLGADVWHRNDAGEGVAAFLVQRTRMRMLDEEQMLPILQTLLGAGADARATGTTGQSAYDLARKYDLWDIATFLKGR